jgi:hypothetical protein
MAEHLEIEQKFDVDAGFERPPFTGLPGVSAAAPVLHHLSATYFDTADGRLAASKITLRRRTGGTDEGWHLKLPASAGARREVHAPLGAADREVPEVLAARVAEVTGGQPLAPIAQLNTERTVVTLTASDGRVVAEVADDLVTAWRLPETDGTTPAARGGYGPSGSGVSPGGTVAPRETGPGDAPDTMAPFAIGRVTWREVEVEVPEADPELQRAAAEVLFAAGARPAGHGSKLARVLDG